jgi:hypothetical protein
MAFAYVFLALAVVVAMFQCALALGAPLGAYTLGGKFPGKLPAKMRVAAFIQIWILALFTVIVVSKSGIAFEGLYGISRIAIWVVFSFFILGSILNLSSPSKKERAVMGPLNVIALICTLMVAIK